MTIINIIRYYFNRYFKTYNRLYMSWSLAPIDMAVPCEPQPCTCLKASFAGIYSTIVSADMPFLGTTLFVFWPTQGKFIVFASRSHVCML